MTRRLLFLALVLACSLPARAQFTISAPPTAGAPGTVEVRGTGEAKMAHDRAVVRVSFETEGETAEAALAAHQKEVDRVQALLRGAGVPDDQVFLDRSSVGASGQMDRMGMGMGMGGSSEDGFSASRQLTVYVDDLERVPALVAQLASDKKDDLLAVNQRQVTVSYVVRDPEALQRQALRDAVADARDRAALMAEMAGVRLGRIVSLKEDGAGGSLFDAMGAGMMAGMMGANGLEPGTGEYRVSMGVSVTFVLD